MRDAIGSSVKDYSFTTPRMPCAAPMRATRQRGQGSEAASSRRRCGRLFRLGLVSSGLVCSALTVAAVLAAPCASSSAGAGWSARGVPAAWSGPPWARNTFTRSLGRAPTLARCLARSRSILTRSPLSLGSIGVINADLFHEAAIARHAQFGDDNTIIGPLLVPPRARQIFNDISFVPFLRETTIQRYDSRLRSRDPRGRTRTRRSNWRGITERQPGLPLSLPPALIAALSEGIHRLAVGCHKGNVAAGAGLGLAALGERQTDPEFWLALFSPHSRIHNPAPDRPC